MKSVKLTVSMREKIVKDIMIHRFRKQADQFTKEHLELVDKFYREIYCDATRQKMDALPNGWLPHETNFRIKTPSTYYHIYTYRVYDPDVSNIASEVQGKKYRVPYHLHHATHVIDNLNLINEYEVLREKIGDLRAEMRKAKNTLSGNLSKFNTTKQLVDAWPEVRPFIKVDEDIKVQLPAVPVKELNELLDLPV